MVKAVGVIAIMALSLQGLGAGAAPLKVDFSFPARNDAIDPHFVQWVITNGPSVSRTFGGVNVTFTKVGPVGIGLESAWYKGGVDYDARMVTDGIRVENGDAGAQIEMRIANLTPGTHSVVTYHNTYSNPATHTFSRIHVSVNGERRITGLMPSNRALDNYDVPTAYVEFAALAGQDVVILFEADTADAAITDKNVTISGFEIDTVDPARKAIKPSPRNEDEHADANATSLTLTWVAPTSATSHNLYFGTDAATVDNATTASAAFKGNQPAVGFVASDLNNFDEYYWRVDEVEADGRATKGELWRFRIRHQAFPTAEGYGRFARGGRLGRVIEVTNLNDSGPGSLRAAVEDSGPRTVVFNVSGMITLESKLQLRNAYITVAGQTAPGKGICIRKYNFGLLGADDAIIRYVRVRPGNIASVTLDGMGMASSDHSIIDHCSISWTIDEAFSSRSARNITLQRTLISEALNEAGHSNYPAGERHGFAASIGGNVGSFHHNLLAHCYGRNWSLAGGLNQAGVHTGRLDIRNNVVYNWGSRTTDGGAMMVNFVRNYYKPGPATTSGPFTELNPQFENPGFGPQQYYVEGNVMEGHHGPEGPLGPFEGVDPQGSQSAPVTVPTPFFEHYVATQSAAGAYANVLANVGCNVPALDDHDQRVIGEVLNGTFTYRGSKTNLPGLPDSQDDVGGWEVYPEVQRPAGWDTDHDGMPDWWEKAHPALNPSHPDDRNDDPDGDGYTNLEDYLNYLAGEFAFMPRLAADPAGWNGYR